MFRNPFRRRGSALLEVDLTAMRFEPPAEGSGLGNLLAAMAGAGAGSAMPEPEVCAVLKSFAANYGRCPFHKGDFVTRRANTGGHGEGWPALVLEVSATPHQNFYLDSRTTPESDPDYGARYDMRILHRNADGRVHAHWVESWLFEPYALALTVGVDFAAGRDRAVQRIEGGRGEVGTPYLAASGWGLWTAENEVCISGIVEALWEGELQPEGRVFWSPRLKSFTQENGPETVEMLGWKAIAPADLGFATVEVR